MFQGTTATSTASTNAPATTAAAAMPSSASMPVPVAARQSTQQIQSLVRLTAHNYTQYPRHHFLDRLTGAPLAQCPPTLVPDGIGGSTVQSCHVITNQPEGLGDHLHSCTVRYETANNPIPTNARDILFGFFRHNAPAPAGFMPVRWTREVTYDRPQPHLPHLRANADGLFIDESTGHSIYPNHASPLNAHALSYHQHISYAEVDPSQRPPAQRQPLPPAAPSTLATQLYPFKDFDIKKNALDELKRKLAAWGMPYDAEKTPIPRYWSLLSEQVRVLILQDILFCYRQGHGLRDLSARHGISPRAIVTLLILATDTLADYNRDHTAMVRRRYLHLDLIPINLPIASDGRALRLSDELKRVKPQAQKRLILQTTTLPARNEIGYSNAKLKLNVASMPPHLVRQHYLPTGWKFLPVHVQDAYLQQIRASYAIDRVRASDITRQHGLATQHTYALLYLLGLRLRAEEEETNRARAAAFGRDLYSPAPVVLPSLPQGISLSVLLANPAQYLPLFPAPATSSTAASTSQSTRAALASGSASASSSAPAAKRAKLTFAPATQASTEQSSSDSDSDT